MQSAANLNMIVSCFLFYNDFHTIFNVWQVKFELPFFNDKIDAVASWGGEGGAAQMPSLIFEVYDVMIVRFSVKYPTISLAPSVPASVLA